LAIARLAGLLAAVLWLLMFPSPSGAAKPVAGARYLGEGMFGEVGPFAALQVAADGRRFGAAGTGSFIECGREATGDTVRFRLRRPRRIRIGSDGRFAFVLRRRAAELWVRGRFRTRDTIRLTERTQPRSFCDSGALTLHRKFERSFTGCRSQPARTLVESDTGRIFQQREFGASDPYYFTPIAYGCLYSANEPVALGEDGKGLDGHGQDLSHFRLAGAFAGFASNVCPIDYCANGVEAVDLRDGKTKRHSGSRGPGTDSGGHLVWDVALSDNGSIAWISSQDREQTEVWADDALGVRKLDSGNSIQPKSLSLTGATLTWRAGTETRSALLY
jgi:hypothetical protein